MRKSKEKDDDNVYLKNLIETSPWREELVEGVNAIVVEIDSNTPAQLVLIEVRENKVISAIGTDAKVVFEFLESNRRFFCKGAKPFNGVV